MEKALTNLAAVLSAMNIPRDNDTQEKRNTVQKAVYFAQLKGVPLHYEFNGHTSHPFSDQLARDHHALSQLPKDTLGRYDTTLVEPYSSRVAHLTPALRPPEDTGLSQPEWLALLCDVLNGPPRVTATPPIEKRAKKVLDSTLSP